MDRDDCIFERNCFVVFFGKEGGFFKVWLVFFVIVKGWLLRVNIRVSLLFIVGSNDS